MSKDFKKLLGIFLSFSFISFFMLCFLSIGTAFIITSIVFTVSFIVFLGLLVLYRITDSPFTGTVKLKGLNNPVCVKRDVYGIPHIKTNVDDLDAFFALGFVHAQDRFWQMEFQRRTIKGKLSAVLGEQAVESDKYFRTLGYEYIVVKVWDGLTDYTKKILTVYTAGVNAFLETGKLPLQFLLLRYRPEMWSVFDSLLCQKMLSISLETNMYLLWENHLLRDRLSDEEFYKLHHSQLEDAPTTLDENDLRQSGLYSPSGNGDGFLHITMPARGKVETSDSSNSTKKKKPQGSNAWVLSGKVTNTGAPILANDTHLYFTAPNAWYLAMLQGKMLDVCGATYPGIPCIVIGHNRHIAWGITNSYADTAHLYFDKFNIDLYQSETLIEVRGKKPIRLKIEKLLHRPVVNGLLSPAPHSNTVVSAKLASLLSEDTSLDGFININYARNWQGFREAAKTIVTPSVNILYADVEDNIGYQLVGKIPITSEDTFTGSERIDNYVPFEKLPYILNPSKCYIVSANNKICDDNYLYILSKHWFEPSFRIKRITSLISKYIAKQQLLSPEIMAQMQLDNYSELWNLMRSHLLEAQVTDQFSQLALSELRKWDGEMGIDSVGATIFIYWLQEMLDPIRSALKIEFRRTHLVFLANQLLTNDSFLSSLIKSNPSVHINQSLKSATRLLVKRCGNKIKQWQWGKIHKAYFIGLGLSTSWCLKWLFNRSISVGGYEDTINNIGIPMLDFKDSVGPTYRQIINMADLADSQFIIPMGQSGNPMSKNYKNLLSLWRDGKYVKLSHFEAGEKILSLFPKN